MSKATDIELQRWRALNAEVVVLTFAAHAKEDATFQPIKARSTTRWHATVGQREYELLLTGPKFYDSRLAKGGGGAVDLAMHLLEIDFAGAVKVLRVAGL